jgi:protein-L-isoaspartate(D-aspartate) O-methyltransferase
MRRLPTLARLVTGWGLAVAFVGAVQADEGRYAEPRAEMIRTIIHHAAYSAHALDGKAIDPRVLDVMGAVPRHAFLPDGGSGRPARRWWEKLLADGGQAAAYEDRALPIGYGQTMSQPFVVALMTHLLKPQPSHVVLEIGTGSGYQAAVLAPLVRRVCTIEIIPQLAKTAAVALAAQGYRNVRTRTGDGYDGWPGCGPFDGIVVTAAASHIPPPLVRQLKPGGRMVIPVGTRFSVQQLTLIEKDAHGKVTTRQLLPVAFVPLVRGE